ncbi:nucleolar protein 14 [Dothidotthia symphoricarpi CBS 119687]|uniref:Nucleolar protein 14 n=1 Tax=Dothidotthia symphoricarpi CBS 119687 TaxID=1392245 RepID=A0A6A6AMJ6_9PLEO|nr:nucleolar protein 14 [Dothidotthia symphoricarpi CBS 119687]KAF2132786.1 nucleolar protein 14 [Dothidotthia symphoricarpi CBS 119687]
MPPSQLKRLKASLREQGLTGPQKSKKQKKAQNKNVDARAQKASALASIRESFNPFEFKHLSRPKKFSYATAQPENAQKKILGRPGVTKSQGEEARRKSLLPEMNRKNKVGGILDRRIGENDPTMSLDDRMMARFEREQQRKRGGNMFDLEDGDEEIELTHGGESLRFDDEIGDEDYDAASVSGSSVGDADEDGLKRKRGREDVDGEEGEGVPEEQPERKKSKAEVMKEVMAKSKLHKYERQAQKEDDDDLRDELDKDLNNVLEALRGHINKKPEPEQPKETPKNDFGINADRAALLAGTSQAQKDREYDIRVRQLLQDERAKPTERTKTEEEKAKEDANRLKELEEKRMKRMRGEPISDDEEPQKKKKGAEEEEEEDDDDDDMESENDDAAEFGLAAAPGQFSRPVGVDDEDDFVLDDDLIATDSEADISGDESDDASEVDDTMAMDDEDADFLKDVLPEPKVQPKAKNGVLTIGSESTSSKLAYTYACPRSHEELLTVFKDVTSKDISTVIQRIRALYHSGLHADNKHKLADFACALVDHASYLSNQTPAAPLSVIESIIRHVHSMSRSYPAQIATHFREHLKKLQISNEPTPGDLTLLTAIGYIYPTSDHFHQVVTPAITLMARWMGLTTPNSAKDIATGAFVGAVCLQYQKLSKRYIPEFIRYTALCLKSPHATPALLKPHTKNILTASDLWSASPAFIEIFTPLLSPLKSAAQTATSQNLRARLNSAKLRRRPQTLHFHRPLPIKSSVPKFEESFDPNKHYDPDKERSEATRLQKEYKREKKGALRELRKDANFIARESLREKKDKDRKYEEKYKRLVAEIQGEEGREKNVYEREKRKRQKN